MTFKDYMANHFKNVNEGRLKLKKEEKEQQEFVDKVNTTRKDALYTQCWRDHLGEMFNPIKHKED